MFSGHFSGMSIVIKLGKQRQILLTFRLFVKKIFESRELQNVTKLPTLRYMFGSYLAPVLSKSELERLLSAFAVQFVSVFIVVRVKAHMSKKMEESLDYSAQEET